PGAVQEHRDQRVKMTEARAIPARTSCERPGGGEESAMGWRINRAVALGVLAAWLLGGSPFVRASGPDQPSRPLRALILSGEGPAGPNAATPALKGILADSGRFDVRVCESCEGLTGATLSPFDLVVVAAGLARGGDTERAVAAFVASGKGLVIAQGAF